MTMYPYDSTNPDHAKFKVSLDYLNGLAKNIDEITVYHISIGKFDMMGEIVECINYLNVSTEYDMYQMNWEKYGMVLAYVNNVNWDVQEFGSIGVRNIGGMIKRLS